ncbi:uncharacterized protein LOC136081674 isoform X2 [Hydra vulgaris]|uniref:Uncharacterized protein LOC136081674 isoform X2 n=1 Tax=Hydra vulgaris TaxID=6087 RepID=A0ABM4C1L4_HYDVU
MKAIKVIFKENAEIVIASSSNFLDFCAAVRETFNLPMIEEVKWNSCKVNASSFAALINEQNLEFTIQAPQLVDILNSQQVSLELNKADTAQSSPLCQFSSIVNDYVDFVVPSNKINWNFENQCIAEECHVNVVQPPVSQLSTSVAQYMAEECRVNVVQPPVRQISSSTSSSSSPNTPKTPRKISTILFDSDEVARLRTFLSTSTLKLLNNVLANDIMKKELKNSILQYCQVVLPFDNDPWVRREFFSKLKSTLLFNFPNCLEHWDSLLRQVSNTIKQQRWTKSHPTSNGTAIRQFQQVSKPKKSPYIMDSISKAEPVLSEEQLLLEVESDDLVDELKIPAKYGPQVLFNSTQYGVQSRSGCEMISTDLRTIKEVLCVIVSIYYLLDLSYPSSFSQLMGLF